MMTNLTTQRLRMVEPFHTEAHVTAETFFARLGSPGIVVIQADTDEGPADITLTPREAYDLMLWLQCALGISDIAEHRPIDVNGLSVRCKHGQGPACQLCMDENSAVEPSENTGKNV